jgi:hypothetical protein
VDIRGAEDGREPVGRLDVYEPQVPETAPRGLERGLGGSTAVDHEPYSRR